MVMEKRQEEKGEGLWGDVESKITAHVLNRSQLKQLWKCELIFQFQRLILLHLEII